MTEGSSSDQGCGRDAARHDAGVACPECGARLRLVGNPRTIKYRLECGACGYLSHELSIAEAEEILDR